MTRSRNASAPSSDGSTAYEVRHSPIHGRGLFATREFRRGDLIGTFEGVPTRRNGTYVLWLFDDETDEAEGLRVTNDLRFMNHAGRPNAELDELEVRARRRIRAGDEITIDYGEDWSDL